MRLVLLPLTLLPLCGSPLSAFADQFVRRDGNAAGMAWRIEHDKEDGTGDDVCIASGWINPAMGSVSLRKDATKPEHSIRVDDPQARLPYGVGVPVALIYDGDRAKIWNGTASGTGRVFDITMAAGPQFQKELDQFTTAEDIFMEVGGQPWGTRMGGQKQAVAILQDCLASVETGDGRW